MIVCSKLETVVLSATGDILTCRSRDDYESPLPKNDETMGQEAIIPNHISLEERPTTAESYNSLNSYTSEQFLPSIFASERDSRPNLPRPSSASRSARSGYDLSTSTHTLRGKYTSTSASSFRSYSVPKMRGGLLGGAADATSNLASAYTWGNESGLSVVNTTDAEEESKQEEIYDVASNLLYSETQTTYNHSENGETRITSASGLSFDESVSSMSTMTMSTIHHGKVATSGQNELTPINEDRNISSDHSHGARNTWDTGSCSVYSSSTIRGPKKNVPYNIMHGIPTFLSSMAQIKVTKVSAHPRGEHVLLISEEALLFSYGLNNHGQLGRGGRVRTPSTKTERNFMPNPAIVTPLLENGGKTIDCAAGISHSLVTVKTDGNRVGRLHRREGAKNKESIPNEMVSYHQLYGFGHNAFFKLGLVDPTPKKKSSKRKSGKSSSTSTTSSIDENVTVPRRVALHCEIWPEDRSSTYEEPSLKQPPKYGIFAIACGEHHSAALVRKASGKIQLYTWGKADECALGHTYRVIEASYKLLDNLPFMSKRRKDIPMSGAANDIVPVPTAVSSLTYDPQSSKSPSKADFTIGRDSRKGRPLLENGEYVKSMALGKSSTFVITSSGRCFSFGTSKEGLLGLGYDVSRVVKPTEIRFSTSNQRSNQAEVDRKKSGIKMISIGARHALAISKDNVAFAWGVADNGRLGVSRTGTQSPKPSHHRKVIWWPMQVKIPSSCKLSHRVKKQGKDGETVVHVCAGYDNSFFVTEDGKVLSCGRSSGRLGLGENDADIDVSEPTSMFGGLHIWHNHHASRILQND